MRRSFCLTNGFIVLPVLTLLWQDALAQINLGTFNLNKNQRGDLELGFGQGGSLFGFGGDRALQATIGEGIFGARTDSGVMLGGERVGVDSHLGLQQGRGLNLGSLLKLGNRPVNPFDSVGQLNSLLNNLGQMFQPRPRTQPTNLVHGRLPTSSIHPKLIETSPNPNPISVPSSKRTDIPNGGGVIRNAKGDGDETFPPSVGRGWDGEDYGESEKPTGTLPSGNIPTKTGITTEGRRRDGTSTPKEEKQSPNGKHDGETGEAAKSKKLPVPDGLEMIGEKEDGELLKN